MWMPSQSGQYVQKLSFFLDRGGRRCVHLPNCPDDLISLRGWRGSRLAAHGCIGENSYLLINDLYWRPSRAHLRLWEASPGLNGFYSRLNYFSLAIVPSRACVMRTIFGLKRSTVLGHLHSGRMPWDAGIFSIFEMVSETFSVSVNLRLDWNLFFFCQILEAEKNQYG